MKKVLWLVNAELPQIAAVRKRQGSKSCGWISGAYPYIHEHYSLVVVYPVFSKDLEKECLEGEVQYVSFYQSGLDSCDKKQQKKFRELLARIKPDVIDIWGTEFIRSYNMIAACKESGYLNRTVISMQGSSSEIASHYFSNLRGAIIHKKSLRDWLRFDSISRQRRLYMKRGKYEKIALQTAEMCIGKTDWDQSVCTVINPDVRYYRCNEILRSSFYSEEKRWNPDLCKRHSILMCQGNYPVKGLHIALEALICLKAKCPDVLLVVSGTSPVSDGSRKDRLKMSAYGQHIEKIIHRNGLQSNVLFVGMQDERQIIDLYLSSNAVIVASSIENESNSVSEAQYLGVPVVTSCVGGVASRIIHEKNGFCYPYDEPHMLAFYLDKIFSDRELSIRLSENGQLNAQSLVSKSINDVRRSEIYNTIISTNSKPSSD